MTYNEATNRVTTTPIDYDAAGNQTRIWRGDSTGMILTYDAASRLVEVKTGIGAPVLSYRYGSSNQRLMTIEGGYKTYYAAAGGTVLAEYVEADWQTQPQWTKSYINFGGNLIATIQPNGASEYTQYHHPDRLGTRVITNNQDSNFQEQVALPFGTALNAESTGATNRRFTSYDRSNTTGLDYAVNRHYDSNQGRFTQVDPIGMGASSLADPQSLNLYAYCGNDPVNHTDPKGLFFKKLFKWISKALKWIAVAVMVAIVVMSGPFAPASGTLLAKALGLIIGIGSKIGVGLNFISGGSLLIEGATVAAQAMLGIGALMAASSAVGAIANQAQRRQQKRSRRREKERSRRYPTIDDAAIAALRAINSRSILEDIEYGGRICETNGQYIYTGPVVLGEGGGSLQSPAPKAPCPEGSEEVGQYHTHGSATSESTPGQFEVFSNRDIAEANSLGQPTFIGTPSGGIRVYDPAYGVAAPADYKNAGVFLPERTPVPKAPRVRRR